MVFLARSVAALAVLVAASVLALSLIEPVAPPDLPPDKQVIDMHVHVAGLGHGCDDCFVSPEIRDSYKFAWYLRAFGTSAPDMQARGDGVVVERLREYIHSSRWVAQVVVLALDGVIDADGELDRDATQVYVPNDYVAELAAGDSALLFGASINPYRTDAVERLQRASDDGAVLVKWIPAIMAIDPADPRLDQYYARLVALGLPLLVHVGAENAFHHADNQLGDPLRLKRPLDLGVTVIAAHIATTGDSEGIENFERLLTMFADHPNLYTEISSLTQINKLGYLKRALALPGLDHRMLYGSDWPLQFFPLVWAGWHAGSAPLAQLRFTAQLDNPFDRDIALKSALGVPASVFARTGRKLLHGREKL